MSSTMDVGGEPLLLPPAGSASQCDLSGYYGDALLHPCASFASTVADSGMGTGGASSASLASSASSATGLSFTVGGQPLSAAGAHRPKHSPRNQRAPWVTRLSAHMHWLILIVFAYVRSLLLRLRLEKNHQAQERECQRDFVPLYRDWESLFTLYIYRRLRDILNRPIAGCPGAHTVLKDRYTQDNCWNFQYTGGRTRVLNLGSYNYLGFAQADGRCAGDAVRTLRRHGVATCSSLHEFGKHRMHVALERRLADFLRVEAALVYPMGFGTNTMNVPCFVDKDALVLSDELNHASLILGCRLSGAHIKVFKHNDCQDLERKLVDAIRRGNPKTGQPYSKMLIVIEGLYSMEGTIPHLREVVALKKKYKAYLFLDEAHSIGSLGRTGRGVTEYWGVPATDVDVLMGTFTKSFSAAGGYIAGSRAMIEHVRRATHACYASTMSPPVAQQVLSVLDALGDERPGADGIRRLAQLRANTRYFRRRLKRAGFLVYGNDDSPVVPALLYFPAKVALFSRALLKRRIGVVVVGFPATPIATERARFCLSSGHTKDDLDYAISCIVDAADLVEARYFKPRTCGPLVLNSRPPPSELRPRDDYYNAVYAEGSERYDWVFDENDADPEEEIANGHGAPVVFE